MDDRLISDRFPRASGYHPDWVLAGVSGGANPLWLTEWLQLVAPANEKEIRALEADAGRYFGYVRAVGRIRAEAQLFDPPITAPAVYERKPLLRGSA